LLLLLEMGCCSSTRSASASPPTDVSPGNAPIPNANVKDPHRDGYSAEPMAADVAVLRDYEDEASESEEEAVSRPSAFANNQSIANEVMRLEEFQTASDPGDDDAISPQKSDIKLGRRNRMEIKTNENSEERDNAATKRDNRLQATLSPSYERDRYHPNKQQNRAQVSEAVDFAIAHPFGLVETQQPPKHDVVDELLAAEKVDVQALYAENLKGFDADKFRTANVASQQIARKSAKNHSLSAVRGKSPDDEFSSFTSSEMSSKSMSSKLEPINSARGSAKDKHNEIIEFDDTDDEEEDDHDLLMQELSRPHSSNYKGYDEVKANEETTMSHLESFQGAGKEESNLKHIMDDEDEELMDAILSLDLDD